MTAYQLGSLLGALAIPAVGLVLVIFGLVLRKRAPSGGEPPKRRTGLIVIGSVVLVLGLAGAVLGGTSASDSSGGDDGVAVGECVTADDYVEGRLQPVDCASPAAVLEVASKGGPDAMCPDGKARSETAYTSLVWDDATVCLVANFIEGQCYSINAADTSDSPLRAQTCGTVGAQVKALRRFDGTTDDRVCPPGSNPVSYVEPQRVVCLGRA